MSSDAVNIAKQFLINKNKDEYNNLNKINNSNDNNRDVKLNIFIFNQISEYLVINKSFKEILELSLLSKSTFKIFQNVLISNEFNKNKFILSLIKFMNYIKKTNNNQESYANKLIQYKELVKIRLNYYEIPLARRGKLGAVQKFMNINCPEMKQIAFLDYVNPNFKTEYDHTCDSFYKFKKLYLYWDVVSCYPFSYDDDEVEDDEDVDQDFALEYDYSFSFLFKYCPTKILIQTDSYKYNAQLQVLDSIWDCDYIKKIKFDSHETPDSFIERMTYSIEDRNLKSLTIQHSLDELSNIKNLIENAPELRKLVFTNYSDFDEEQTELKLPSILESLKINSTQSKSPITKLGLQAFTIDQSNYQILSPLLRLSNIKTLCCNIKSLTQILKHCCKNQNIQHLIIDDYDISGQALIDIYQFVSKLPKTSSFKSIVIYERFSKKVMVMIKNFYQF